MDIVIALKQNGVWWTWTLTIWWSQTADTLSCDRRPPGSPGRPTASLLRWCRDGRKSTPSPHPPPSRGEHWPLDRHQILVNVIQIFIREMDNVLEETTVSKACLFLILGYNPGLGYGRVISSTVNICNYDVHWDSFNSSKITLQYTGNSTLESHWDIIEHSHLIKFMLFYSHTRGPIKWSFASKA